MEIWGDLFHMPPFIHFISFEKNVKFEGICINMWLLYMVNVIVFHMYFRLLCLI